MQVTDVLVPMAEQVRVCASAVPAGTVRTLMEFSNSGLLFKARWLDPVRQALRRAWRDNPHEPFAILIFDTWFHEYLAEPLPMAHGCVAQVCA